MSMDALRLGEFLAEAMHQSDLGSGVKAENAGHEQNDRTVSAMGRFLERQQKELQRAVVRQLASLRRALIVARGGSAVDRVASAALQPRVSALEPLIEREQRELQGYVIRQFILLRRTVIESRGGSVVNTGAPKATFALPVVPSIEALKKKAPEVALVECITLFEQCLEGACWITAKNVLQMIFNHYLGPDKKELYSREELCNEIAEIISDMPEVPAKFTLRDFFDKARKSPVQLPAVLATDEGAELKENEEKAIS